MHTIQFIKLTACGYEFCLILALVDIWIMLAIMTTHTCYCYTALAKTCLEWYPASHPGPSLPMLYNNQQFTVSLRQWLREGFPWHHTPRLISSRLWILTAAAAGMWESRADWDTGRIFSELSISHDKLTQFDWCSSHLNWLTGEHITWNNIFRLDSDWGTYYME